MITIVFILGLIIGSFLNVIIYRMPRGESLVKPRSYCPDCGQKIKAFDLIPILNYIWLKGRCRYCGSRINLHYPLVELVTATALLLIYSEWGWSIDSLVAVILAMLLIPAAVIDLHHGIIPDKISITGIIIGLLISLLTTGFISSLMGALLFGGILLLAAYISGGGMGGGDIKMAAAIGVFTGWQGAILAFMLSSILGGAVGVILLLSHQANRKTAIKFGPFLALGGFIAYVWGARIMDFYLQVIN